MPFAMKMKYLLPACIAAALLAFSFDTLADDGGNDNSQGDENSQGTNDCDIHGLEVMDAYVVLTPASNAPAGASGVVKIDSDDEDGDEAASLNLTAIGLDPGTYTLSVTLQSTGSNVVVGQFNADFRHHDEDGDDNSQGDEDQDGLRLDDHGGHPGFQCIFTNISAFSNCFNFTNGFSFTNCFSNWTDWHGFGNWGCWSNQAITNFCPGTNLPVSITQVRFDLPAGVNPTDIGDITVSDTNGNPILEGNITNPAPATVINIKATVQLSAGTGAPGANGTAQIVSTAEKGKWKHQFLLNGSGFNAHSTFKVSVNGKVSGAAKSSKTGQVKVSKLPSHTSALRSLQLLDAGGNTAASARF